MTVAVNAHTHTHADKATLAGLPAASAEKF